MSSFLQVLLTLLFSCQWKSNTGNWNLCNKSEIFALYMNIKKKNNKKSENSQERENVTSKCIGTNLSYGDKLWLKSGDGSSSWGWEGQIFAVRPGNKSCDIVQTLHLIYFLCFMILSLLSFRYIPITQGSCNYGILQ